MSKLVKKFNLGDMWEYDKNESWYTDMAAKGLHLQSFGDWLVTFEKGEPKKKSIELKFWKKVQPRSSSRYIRNMAGN